MATPFISGRLTGVYGVILAFISLVFTIQTSYGQDQLPEQLQFMQLFEINPVDVPCYFSNVFRCASGFQCIVSYYECDSIVDCADSSDEVNCQAQHTEQCIDDFSGKFDMNNNPLASFKCKSGQCVLGCNRCDRCLDCFDNSDEEDCTINELLNRPPCS